MVEIIFTEKFEKEVRKLDSFIKQKIVKQIDKISFNPEIGKPLRYSLKGERTVYIKPYRIIYGFYNEIITFLRVEHRKNVYV
ncbi:type II toxin-antitoxin system RelE/ParE family toxin [archaeon]|jgi:addiction module RelE/StbE family toxin|nr:type II toxin-antitoxin system RelE/ParE family toxin [archaeon]MBT4241803.1 type II toxin-antitoxin system RelE/ParE family toxin [archaeon]MBT4418351.1 type II toxin-antitoxin system RelE/ParE family toxin [archaeon]